MRNDRKGAPAQNLVGQGTHQSALAVTGMQAVARKCSDCVALAVDMMTARLFAKRYRVAGSWTLRADDRPVASHNYGSMVDYPFEKFRFVNSIISMYRLHRFSSSKGRNRAAWKSHFIRIWRVTLNPDGRQCPNAFTAIRLIFAPVISP
jgi:hypothetical protein